jgi:hypothetical protein
LIFKGIIYFFGGALALTASLVSMMIANFTYERWLLSKPFIQKYIWGMMIVEPFKKFKFG